MKINYTSNNYPNISNFHMCQSLHVHTTTKHRKNDKKKLSFYFFKRHQIRTTITPEAYAVTSYIYYSIKMVITTFQMVIVTYIWFFNKIAKLPAFLQFCLTTFAFFTTFDILTPRHLKINPMILRTFRTF